MVAFCLKPWGLEVSIIIKGSKINHKRTSESLSPQGIKTAPGRRLNAFGDEKFAYSGHYYDSVDDSPFSQTSPRVFSPWDAGSVGYYSMSNNGYDRNHVPKYHRSRSRKFCSVVFHNDS